jgi:hypothetical protein
MNLQSLYWGDEAISKESESVMLNSLPVERGLSEFELSFEFVHGMNHP